MNDFMTESDVIVDEHCCLDWRRSDGTRRACSDIAQWEIQRDGEAMALACSEHLERVLAIVYSYEADPAVLLHVLPIRDFRVHATVPVIGGAATASLRPLPVGCALQERGIVTRDDHPVHRCPDLGW